MTIDEILIAARQCLGTPFRHQGRLVGVGLDCAGVAVHIARVIGVEYVDVQGYGRTPANGQLAQSLDSQPCLEIVPAISGRRPGDLLLMRMARDPQHLAVLTDRETILHAYESAGHCCEHRLDRSWRARIVRVYHFRGVS
ncbi:MAG: NlpC/P60 family protein [Candidatus Accumulibacter sp.]|uniref:NlpC/P60 family protein n=1 Tax=Accumulibacter sp. TaxID=2053492 RepID=UPI00258BCE2E|nr:NlpC/P60 family protein [Accumulibacter sp.]MCM8624142.1 NlpC/P60 family protein [Accumulibacter sp.]